MPIILASVYQSSQRVSTVRWAKRQLLAIITAAIVAALVGIARGWR